MTFRVGQEVVCVDTNWLSNFPDNDPEINEVLTILAIVPSIHLDAHSQALKFVERKTAFFYNGCHFRPVQKTDISIFTAMLAPSPKQRVEA